MKNELKSAVKAVLFSLVLLALISLSARAQEARVQAQGLDRFLDRAVEVVDVTVDQALLKLAAKFLSTSRSPGEAVARELVEDLKGVYVKRYVFENDNEYAKADLDPIRSQLLGPGWARIVGVTSKRGGNNVDVMIMTEGSQIKGLAVFAAEPRAVTFVNVIGPIDIDKLVKLQGQFGIPHLDLDVAPGR